jgi:putative membrane protein
MIGIILKWAAGAAALYIVTQFIPGVSVSNAQSAFIAALLIGLVNATLGNLLKLLTLPIGCLTLGLSSLVINALMFLLVGNLLRGFSVNGFIPAFLGSLAMSLISGALGFVVDQFMSGKKEEKK